MTYELIDLQRLMDVLEKYGADKEDPGTHARKAIEQLKELCRFKINQKVFVRRNNDPEVYPGVVVAYFQHEPGFIVGPGDDRNNLPKDSTMLAFKQEHIYDREEIPEGCTPSKWETLVEKNKRKGGAK